MRIRVLLVAEMVVREAASLADLNAKLDAFREAVLPSDHGITLYQATREDLTAFIGCLWMPVATPRGDLLRIGRRPCGDLTTSLPRV